MSADVAALPASVRAVALRPRSTVAVLLVSVAGLLAFCWPLLVDPGAGLAHGTDAPLVLGLLLPLLLAVVLFEIGEGGLDVKALACSACSRPSARRCASRASSMRCQPARPTRLRRRVARGLPPNARTSASSALALS